MFKKLIKFLTPKRVSDLRHISTNIIFSLFTLGMIGLLLIFYNIIVEPIPFELEGQCNTGNINVNFQGEFQNQPYKEKRLIDGKNISLIKYNTEFYPKSVSFDGLQNLNCRYKIKGAIPKNIIISRGW